MLNYRVTQTRRSKNLDGSKARPLVSNLNKKNLELCGFEGFSVTRLLRNEDGSYRKLLREVGFYGDTIDIVSDHIVEAARNIDPKFLEAPLKDYGPPLSSLETYRLTETPAPPRTK